MVPPWDDMTKHLVPETKSVWVFVDGAGVKKQDNIRTNETGESGPDLIKLQIMSNDEEQCFCFCSRQKRRSKGAIATLPLARTTDLKSAPGTPRVHRSKKRVKVGVICDANFMKRFCGLLNNV